MRHPNWLETLNPFNLGTPPATWLAELWTFDPDLVVFPSSMEPMYRLTRRAPNSPGIQTVVQRKSNDGSHYAANLDTQTCWEHHLVPVTSIHPHANWSPVLLQDLAEADLKRWGGHAKVSELLEQREIDQQAKLESDERDGIGMIAGARYRALKWRTGQTVDPAADKARTTPPTRSGFRRVMETQGALIVNVPTPERDRGLVQLTDG